MILQVNELVILLSLSAILIALFVIYTVYLRTNVTSLYYHNTEVNERILLNCSSLKSYKRIPMWGISGHFQTIFASQIRKGPTYPYKREVLTNKHGGSFAIDWMPFTKDDPTAPILCVFPGIAGHTDNDYIKNFVHYSKLEGFRVVAWNWPGCGDYNYLTSPYMPTLGSSDDIKTTIEHVHNKYPNALLYSVGFSLGANLLLKYLGESGDSNPIISAVAVSAGYCGKSGLRIIKRNKFYSRALVKKWKKVFVENAEIIGQRYIIEQSKIDQIKMLHELDEEITLKICGYEKLEEYYENHACITYMKNIKRPTLLLNALDDPIVLPELVELAKREVGTNDNLILGTTKRGGHMGWIQGGFFRPDKKLWLDEVALEFIHSCKSVLRE